MSTSFTLPGGHVIDVLRSGAANVWMPDLATPAQSLPSVEIDYRYVGEGHTHTAIRSGRDAVRFITDAWMLGRAIVGIRERDVPPLSHGGTVTGRVVHLERRRSSANGNPSWRVEIEHDNGHRTTHTTAPDISLSGRIDNAEYRELEHVFLLDDHNRITGLA